jgi:hypothetical protein
MQADQVAKVVGALGTVVVGVFVIAKIAVWHLAAMRSAGQQWSDCGSTHDSDKKNYSDRLTVPEKDFSKFVYQKNRFQTCFLLSCCSNMKENDVMSHHLFGKKDDVTKTKKPGIFGRGSSTSCPSRAPMASCTALLCALACTACVSMTRCPGCLTSWGVLQP